MHDDVEMALSECTRGANDITDEHTGRSLVGQRPWYDGHHDQSTWQSTCASCRDADGHGTSRRGDGRLFRPALPATSSAAAAFAEATAPWHLRGCLGGHLGGLALPRRHRFSLEAGLIYSLYLPMYLPKWYFWLKYRYLTTFD